MKKSIFKISFALFFIYNIAFSQVGIGNTSPTTALDVTGALSLREGTALALTSAATNNDISLGTTPYSSYRIASTSITAAFTIAGLVPVITADGQTVTLENTTTYNLTIKHEGTTSTAANRIYCPGGVDILVIGQYATVTLTYNKTQQRWVVVGTTGNTSTSIAVKSTTIDLPLYILDIDADDAVNLGLYTVYIDAWTTGTAVAKRSIGSFSAGAYSSSTAAATTLTSIAVNGWLSNISGSNSTATIHIMKYSLGTASGTYATTVTGTSLGNQVIPINSGIIAPVRISIGATSLAAGDVIICMLLNGSNNNRQYEFSGQLVITQ